MEELKTQIQHESLLAANYARQATNFSACKYKVSDTLSVSRA